LLFAATKVVDALRRHDEVGIAIERLSGDGDIVISMQAATPDFCCCQP
jgi:hypothetical protein